jgi:hypothetical protein
VIDSGFVIITVTNYAYARLVIEAVLNHSGFHPDASDSAHTGAAVNQFEYGGGFGCAAPCCRITIVDNGRGCTGSLDGDAFTYDESRTPSCRPCRNHNRISVGRCRDCRTNVCKGGAGRIAGSRTASNSAQEQANQNYANRFDHLWALKLEQLVSQIDYN